MVKFKVQIEMEASTYELVIAVVNKHLHERDCVQSLVKEFPEYLLLLLLLLCK